MSSDSLHPKANQPAANVRSGTSISTRVAVKVHEIAKIRTKTSEAIVPSDPIEIMQYAEIELGKLLGTGSFSSAFRVKSLRKQPCETLVMKKLRPEVLRNPLVFAACAADLQQEGNILASLDHPNIIHLKAWSGNDMIEPYIKGSHVSAYLILDRLQETLDERIGTWIQQKPKIYYSKKRKTQLYELLQQEKSIHTVSLARALGHLHDKYILHRDLKAANIGFDADGVLKVFDFDLARVLPSERDELFQLTRNVGSPRYMAPEVSRGDKYNLTADVYSFGILVYQIMTLKKPQASLERDWSQNNSALPTTWSKELREVLKNCVSEKISVRPYMDKINAVLEGEITLADAADKSADQNDGGDPEATTTPVTTVESIVKDFPVELPPVPEIGASQTTPTSEKSNNASTILLITYLNLALYALCYQLQSPVEPFLVKSLVDKNSSSDGSSVNVSRAYGNLQSCFQTIQTIGSPLVGILLDRLGIQKTSALVFLASAISYAMLSMATDLTSLFCSKIPTVLQAAFLVAQATATTTLQNDSTQVASTIDAARAAALGRMTTAYTVGATLGPTIGGNLADRGDYSVGAKLAVAGSLLSVVLSLWFLPDTAKKVKESEENAVSKRSFLQELKHSGQLLVRSGLWPLLMIKILGGVIASMHSTVMPLIMTKDLDLEPSQLGLVMSSSMFAVAAFGAVAMAPLTQYLHSARIFGMIQLGLLLRAVFGCGLAWIVSFLLPDDYKLLYSVIGFSICHALASHTLATGLTTQTTGMVSKEEQGSLLGLEHGLFSLARIVGPTLGTRLLEWKGLWAVEMTCGLVDVLLAVLAVFLLVQAKEKSL